MWAGAAIRTIQAVGGGPGAFAAVRIHWEGDLGRVIWVQ